MKLSPKASENPFLEDNDVQITIREKIQFSPLGSRHFFAYSFFFVIMGFITFHQFADLTPVELCLSVCQCSDLLCLPITLHLLTSGKALLGLGFSLTDGLKGGSPKLAGCPCSRSFLFTFGCSGICLRLDPILAGSPAPSSHYALRATGWLPADPSSQVLFT